MHGKLHHFTNKTVVVPVFGHRWRHQHPRWLHPEGDANGNVVEAFGSRRGSRSSFQDLYSSSRQAKSFLAGKKLIKTAKKLKNLIEIFFRCDLWSWSTSGLGLRANVVCFAIFECQIRRLCNLLKKNSCSDI